MNYCNRQLLLPLEEDGPAVYNIILFYQTHSLISYATKERNCKFCPCHGKSLVEFGRRPRQACCRQPIQRRRRRRSDQLSSPPLSSSLSLSYVVVTSLNIGGGGGGHKFVVVLSELSRLIPCMIHCVHGRRPPKDDEPVLVAHRNSPRINWRLVISWKNKPVRYEISRINPLCW